MLGIKFQYKNNKGVNTDITSTEPQYIYLEPKEKVVIRYFFTKDGLDVSSTKLISNVVEPEILSVKIRKPKGVYLSAISEFSEIPERQDNAEYFEVDFTSSDQVAMDVLYSSLIDSRLKIGVKDMAAETDSFENENTVTDGPDAFVKLVAVTIKNNEVYYVYVYRRSGRLKKSPNTVTYERLSRIFKERLFTPNHPDASLNYASIVRGLQREECLIDYTEGKISKMVRDKEVILTDAQVGDIMRRYADARDIINLLKTVDVNLTQHPLIVENSHYYVSCDKDCSLPEAIAQNSVDERGML